MTITLKTNPTDKVIELGGGSHPLIHPNVDVRQCFDEVGNPTVDFTADFHQPLPIQSDEWDGVYSQFAIEHIAYPKVPQFLSEVLRILKPGGKAVIVTANTEAQLKWALEHPEGWDGKDMFESASCKLFGDQRHGEREGDPNPNYDSHKCYFSPSILTRLFQEAGFVEIQTVPYGARDTDIIVEAKKPKQGTVHGEVVQYPPNTWVTSGRSVPSSVIGKLKSEVEVKTLQSPEILAKAWDHLQQLPENKQLDDPDPDKLPHGLAPMSPLPNHDRADLEEERKIIDGDPTAPKPQGVIYASRPDYQPDKLFNRAYFNGGVYRPFYWDYPCHEVTTRHVLTRRPESVLELGCGRGYVLKRLQDAGIPAGGMDVSKHCYLTRVVDGFNLVDMTQPWALNGKDTGTGFDLCFSIAVLDHIPEQFLPQVFAEMERTCKRGLHGINFGPVGEDQTRVTIHPKEWWQLRLPRGHEVVDKNELEAGPFPEEVWKGDGKCKLNIGCAQTMFHHGWDNIDLFDFSPWAQGYGYRYQKIDVRNGIPWGTGGVDLIYCGHMLEYLTYKEGLTFLRECRRVIRPGGVMRIIVPDAAYLMSIYSIPGPRSKESPWGSQPGSLSDFDEVNEGCALAPTAAGKLQALLNEGHQATYDAETLLGLLEQAGFEARVSSFRSINAGPDGSHCDHPGLKQILRETLDTHPALSLYVDAVPQVG